MKKRILSMIIAMIMVITTIPTVALTAWALDVELYPLYVCGTRVTSDNAADVLGDGTVSYDAATYTLTLNGATLTYNSADPSLSAPLYFDLTSIEDMYIPFNVVFKGHNTVTNAVPYEDLIVPDSDPVATFDAGHGIHSTSPLHFKGEEDATLTINATQFAVNAMLGFSLVGGSMTATGENGCGIASNDAVSIGSESVPTNLTATGASCGITSFDMTLTNSVVTATGTGDLSSGMRANTSLLVADSRVEASGAVYGIYASSGNIESGRVTATGTNDHSWGMYANLTVNGGEVIAQGTPYAIEDSDGVTIADTMAAYDENGSLIVDPNMNGTYVRIAAAEDEVEDLSGKIVINMTDTYEDGWNGAFIRIYKDGEFVAQATIASGGSGTLELDYDSEAEYTFYWFPGSYDSECGYTIYVDGVEYTEELLTDPNIPLLTGISFNSDSPAYNAETKTFTIDRSNSLVITLTGENLDLLNGIYGQSNCFSLTVEANSSWFVAPLDLFQSATSTEATFLIDLDRYLALQEDAGWGDMTGFGFSNDGSRVEAAFELNVTAYVVVEIEESNYGTVSYSPAEADEGDEVTLVITPDEGYQLGLLTVTDKDGNPVEYDENYTFTIPEGGVTVTVTFVWAGHEKEGYEIIWEEPFDSETFPEGFTSVDVDGDGHEWQIVEGIPDHGCYDGYVLSSSSYENGVGPFDTNNLLFFPTFDLEDGREYLLSFMVESVDENYPDNYDIHISLDGGETYVWSRGMETAPGDWTEIVLDLSEYAGESVTVVIEHKDYDMFRIAIDCCYLYRKTVDIAAEGTITGASLSIGAGLTVTYQATATQVPDGYTLAMLFTMNGETVAVPTTGKNAKGRFMFPFEGITPQCMGDNIKATLVLLDAHGEVVDTLAVKEEYSIKAYAQYQLTHNASDAKLVQLLTDLLTFGAVSQQYTGYRADSLVTDGVTGLGTPSTALPTESENIQALTPELSSGTRFRSAGIQFDNVNRLYVRFLAETDVKLVVKRNGNVIATETYAAADENRSFYTEGINASQFDDTFTFELYAVDGEGETLVQTLTYSVNTYVYRNMNKTDSETGDLTANAQLAIALYRYGASAKAYVGN